MKKQAIALALFASVSATAVADNIDVDLRDKAIRGSYSMNISGKSGLSVEFGGLHNEDVDQLNDDLIYAGLMVSGDNWSKVGTFNISVGGRAIYTSPDGYDIAAIALGGDVRFSPFHRVGFGGSVYYAPEITSSMDCKKYLETNARADYQLLPQVFVYANYRVIKVDIENGAKDVELDKGLSVGMKLLF